MEAIAPPVAEPSEPMFLCRGPTMPTQQDVSKHYTHGRGDLSRFPCLPFCYSITSYSNATPSGSLSSNQMLAAASLTMSTYVADDFWLRGLVHAIR